MGNLCINNIITVYMGGQSRSQLWHDYGSIIAFIIGLIIDP